MFGSALTLASFVKLIHAVFLGQPSAVALNRDIREVPRSMLFPCLFLAALCIIFGVFAAQIPLKYIILPILGGVNFIGSWYSGLAALLIVIALALGWLFIRAAGIKRGVRQDTMFVGGEPVSLEENRVSGVDFYTTVKEFGALPSIYKKAEAGKFDIYEQGKVFLMGVSEKLQYLHNGVLPTYLVWCLLGAVGIFFWCIK